MANLLVGNKRKYTCRPMDKNGADAQVDLRTAPVWAVQDPAFMSLEADPAGNPMINIGTGLAEGTTIVTCEVDADRGDGVTTLVISSQPQMVSAPGADNGEITEEDL